MDRNHVNNREQKILKTLDHVQSGFSKLILGVLFLCIPVFLLIAIYFGAKAYGGDDVDGYFSLSLAGLFVAAFVCGLVELLCFAAKRALQKENEFDPGRMALPDRGAVTLETALHQMTIRMGVLIWDIVLGFFLVSLLGMTAFLGGNRPLILTTCLVLAALLAAGHFFFSWRWKKRSFAQKMLRNTEPYLPAGDLQSFIPAVEESLGNGLLCYARELILTEDYIIGNTDTALQFIPVAVPRSEIGEITFFVRKPVTSQLKSYDLAMMECRMKSGKTVEFWIGQGAMMHRIQKVLDYHQIGWSEADSIYE